MLRRFLCLSFVITSANAAPWYEEMKIGPAWSNTFEDQNDGNRRFAALKGILLDLGENHKSLFDTETLRMVSLYKGGVNWAGTPWTGKHGPVVGLQNESAIINTTALPGWADPAGSFEDKRENPGFGNLPHATFKGYYRHGSTIILDYEVNGAAILETLTMQGSTLTRSFKISGNTADLLLRLADEKGGFEAEKNLAKSKTGLNAAASGGVQFEIDPKNPDGLLARFPKADAPTIFQIAFSRDAKPAIAAVPDFAKLIAGGPALYPEIIETKGNVSSSTSAPYVTDVLTLPSENPWKSNLRFGGFDFIDEDSAAASTWNGDVWVVRGLKGDWNQLKWQRIASGLFETLGVKVINGIIHVNGRDQITQLIDLNGDGETDHFKTFNRDVIITPNFHEFAFDLLSDKAGNLYYSKAAPVRNGGRGFDPILPHHGTVVRVSADGKSSEVLATGLRAPGGLGIGPNGEITTGENEGTNQPCCKINYVPDGKPRFFGTEASRHFLKDASYTDPLCYLPMDIDNSSGSQVWVPEGADFGVAPGSMLHLSYGKSAVYRVLTQPRGETLQGGVVKLPITLQSSAMRARFHADGSLYILGFRGWQTNAATECAFQRVRHISKVTVPVPDSMEYTATGVRLKFPVELDAELAGDLASFSAQRWDYVRGPQYGSGEFSVDQPDVEARKQALEKESQTHKKRDAVTVESAKLLPDGKTVEIGLAGMKPSMGLKVTYDLEGSDGTLFVGEVNGSVFKD